jgi:O-glycosyl hydrolase
MRSSFLLPRPLASTAAPLLMALGLLGVACSEGESSSPADTTTSSGGDAASGGSGGATTSGGAAATGGAGGSGGTTPVAIVDNPDAKAALVVTVDYDDEKQTIDGFGTSSAWGATPSAANFDAFFSKSKGAGLSILRNRIPFREASDNNDNFMGGGNYTYTTINAGTENEHKKFTLNWGNWDLAKTKALITKIKSSSDYEIAHYMSTPWTPPNNATSKWKLGVADYANHPEVGGYLDPSHYADYADVLADYALEFEANMGVPLSALSLQNEPNYKVTYESADWSDAQFHSFIAVLKSEFEKKGVGTSLPNLRIVAPEDPNFKETLLLPTLNDASTEPVVGIVGVHQYEFGSWNESSYAPPVLTTSLAKGKRIWMTEWNTGDTFSSKTEMEQALLLGRLIDMDMTTASLNAFIYWWCSSLVDDAENPRKLLWVLGQYSRFVRPGAVRLGHTGSLGAGVRISTYRSPDEGQLIAVVVNASEDDVTFALDAGTNGLGDVAQRRTSDSEDLTDAGEVTGGYHYVNVTAQKAAVTTFVAPLLR